MPGYDFALPGAPELAPAGPLGGLGPLELSELVEDAVGKLAFGAIVPVVVEGPEHAPVFLELPLEQVVVGGLAAEAVPVLGQHQRDPAGRDEIVHPVEARAFETRAAVTRILHLLDDLVTLPHRVRSQSLQPFGPGSIHFWPARRWRRGRRGLPSF